ncbi:uncharacterized protein [Watersipora subatra]|uniref:uncharacterized protein n=1 Tax=Watersipora subatra TaxID=2589382 RepID=UPI00355B2151
MGKNDGIRIQLYPGNMRCDIMREDDDTEHEFKFVIPSLTKNKATGNFEIRFTCRSFTFLVNGDNGKPMLKCCVSNLPSNIESNTPPKFKIDDGYIMVTVRKTTKTKWDNSVATDQIEFPPLSEIV